MKAKKHLYGVHHTNKIGLGLQSVKADTQVEARSKFRKKYPKYPIHDIWRIEPDHARYSQLKDFAI